MKEGNKNYWYQTCWSYLKCRKGSFFMTTIYTEVRTTFFWANNQSDGNSFTLYHITSKSEAHETDKYCQLKPVL